MMIDMKEYKFYFKYSSLLGTLSPIVEVANTLEQAKVDLLQTLNDMLDHDGIRPRTNIQSIVEIDKIERL